MYAWNFDFIKENWCSRRSKTYPLTVNHFVNVASFHLHHIKEIYQRTRALLALSFHFKLFGKNLIFKVKKIGKYQLLTLHDVKLLNSSEVNSRGININTWPIFLISLFNISLVNTCVIQCIITDWYNSPQRFIQSFQHFTQLTSS